MSKSGGDLGAQAHPTARDDASKARSVPVLAPRERKFANQRAGRFFPFGKIGLILTLAGGIAHQTALFHLEPDENCGVRLK
ncbi:hypothetical protein HFO49_11525 [Rhizobium leguminosarum]|uniref:hypothetical protein n=1 Tax=Rhizobium leguminosarum TaxID=384 RepID=UPI001C93CD36|nr:hypothetical protein [Rhizobium leguminosarum]MBY5588102.1 hypothetical protein [Rhizobium leguminosarum]MBY5600554.1 hypothetical protein [Rhizobium leguminosarum]